MTVYELIQVLANYPADAPVYIHGAARAWVTTAAAVATADTDAEQDTADAAFYAADEVEPVDVDSVGDMAGRVVIS